MRKKWVGNEWRGTQLTLQLDHINGDRMNNKLDNLRVLCPNCHSQAETFGGRNAKQRDLSWVMIFAIKVFANTYKIL